MHALETILETTGGCDNLAAPQEQQNLESMQ